MSQIDTSMDPGLRAQMLSEVLSLLPAFLNAASKERPGPLAASAELLGLPQAKLNQVLATHAMLSAPIRELIADLPAGVRRPVTSSIRPRVTTRSVNSSIDWAATLRHRATSSPLGGVWVTRPASRVFDVPENRALAWLLEAVEDRAHASLSPSTDASGPWENEIRESAAIVKRSRRIAWLEGLPSRWPGDEVYQRLAADRLGFYQKRVSVAARYLRRLLIDPSPSDQVEALCERYFEPTQDWKLFEIAVLVRLSTQLDAVGTRRYRQPTFSGGRRPFAAYSMPSGREVRLWYQSWPESSGPSELLDAISYYGLKSGGNRPDIVVEFVDDRATSRLIVLELKASTSRNYLASGFAQLLSYLRDRPELTSAPSSGWLVAPAEGSFVNRRDGGRSLWVVSSDDVAHSLVAVAAGQTPPVLFDCV